MNTPSAELEYYVPHAARWPICGSIALFTTMVGTACWFNDIRIGPYIAWAGVALLVIMLFGWFGSVISENERGLYNLQVDKSFRLGMTWFIFTEVMFFGAFFGALFYTRELSVPWLSGVGNGFFTHLLLWDGFHNTWPTAGPAATTAVHGMEPWGIAAINTAILLTSGVTVTIAHHMLRANKRAGVVVFLGATAILGFLFVGLQGYEYVHAYSVMNLRLDTGIYGTTFFMLTGFHGLHVTIGAIMLSVIWIRVLRGHFTAERHFAFEAASWYWHFVDVVWLGLFIFVYWL